MTSNGNSRKTTLWITITGVICIVVGFAAGAATAALRIGQTSQINAIRDRLSTMKALKNSPSDFEKAFTLATRTEIEAAVCSQYSDATDKEKNKMRLYVDEYNSITGDANNPLPPISDTAENGKIRSAYCKMMS